MRTAISLRHTYPSYNMAAAAQQSVRAAVPPPVCAARREDKASVIAAHRSRFNIESKLMDKHCFITEDKFSTIQFHNIYLPLSKHFRMYDTIPFPLFTG